MSTASLDWDWDEEYNKIKQEEHEPWTAPTVDQMNDRLIHRKIIQNQTLQHRRVTDHGGNNMSCSIVTALRGREVYGPRFQVKRRRHCFHMSVEHQLRAFGEYYAVTKYHSSFLKHLGGEDELDENGARPASSAAVSTISIAFSHDSQTMASTHGDHTVKITCCSTGHLLECLEGHPRTPWTVKYHPILSNIVASGCLGFQVRVWDWEKASCLHMIRLDYAIISLSFHPSGHVLAVASGSRLHFWDFDNYGGRGGDQQGAITEVEQRNMLRCVHFPPNGHSIIVGGMNPNQDDPRRTVRGRGGMSGGGISFYLRLWDFDLDSALHPEPMNPSDHDRFRGSVRLQRKPLTNPRTVVPRALLYNDGGFDVSPDGKTLCACAEYWLPDGVDNAMDLLNQLKEEFEKESLDSDQSEEVAKQELDIEPGQQTGPTTPKSSNGSAAPYVSPPRARGGLKRTTFSPPPPPPPSASSLVPITPPNAGRGQLPLSPPSPPGRRLTGGLLRSATNRNENGESLTSTSAAPSRPTTSAAPRSNASNRQSYAIDSSNNSNRHVSSQSSIPLRPPHALSVITTQPNNADTTRKPGRYVPHVVTVSLDTTPIPPQCGVPPQLRGHITSVAKGYRPRLGQLLEACPLDGAKASAVTCVKFAPSSDFLLLGYGVREPISNGQDSRYHPVTALYRVIGGMTHVSTMLSEDDDVNIARFHPDSGYGFVYGTKQGRVRVLSPRPWNYYYYDN